MNQPLDISVIIPIHTTALDVLRALRSYLHYGPSTREIILVVSDIAPQEIDKIRRFTDVHTHISLLTPNPALGIAESCNFAARKAKAKYLLFLDDIELRAEARGLVERLHGKAVQSKTGVVGGLILHNDNKTIQQAGIFLQPGGLSAPIYGGKKRARAVRYYGSRTFPYDLRRSRAVSAVSGATLIARRLFQRAGAFDARFTLPHAQVDLCLRLNAMGNQTWYVGGGSFVTRRPQASMSPLDFDEAVALYERLYPAYTPQIGDRYVAKLTKPYH